MLVLAVFLPLTPATGEQRTFTPSAGTVTVPTGTTIVNSGFTTAKVSTANCSAGSCNNVNSWNAGFSATVKKTVNMQTVLTYNVNLTNISNLAFTFKGCWHGQASLKCNNGDNPEISNGKGQFKILNGATWELLGAQFLINHQGNTYTSDKYATFTASKAVTDSYIQNGQVKIMIQVTGSTVSDFDVQQVTDFAGITLTYTIPPPPPPDPEPDPAPAPPNDGRPNILVIYTDDQRADTLEHMPIVTQRIVNEGTLFNNSFVTTSLCCPSRASFLTGEYVHNHNVWHNTPPFGGAAMFDDDETVATWLKDAGYRTGYVGKWLNGHDINYIPPGWTDWHGTKVMYYDWKMNNNGQIVQYGSAPADYSTDVMRDKGVQFIQTNDDRPFFLWWSSHAPHAPYTAAPRHIGTCDSVTFPVTPNWSEDDMSDKPFWIANNPQINSSHISHTERKTQLCLLKAVDEAVGAMLDSLGNKVNNTIVIYTSDNGFLWGEHNLFIKNQIYEESIKVPLIVVHPNETAKVVNDLALNIDLAPTILELANVTVPASVDGESLMPLVRGNSSLWRDSFILEQIRPNEEGYDIRTHGVRTTTLKWVEHVNIATNQTMAEELYDLIVDPYEMQNLLPSNNTAVLDMRAQLMQDYEVLFAE